MAHSYTLEGFLMHLAEISLELREKELEALEEAAALVEKQAKKEIGEYQDGAGQFGPWPSLADSTQDDRSNQGFSPDEPGLRTGEMRDSIIHKVDDAGKVAVVGSNDDKLVYFELGTDTQPPRSVLGIAAEEKKKEVAEILGDGVMLALVGEKVFQKRMPI